MALQRDRDRHHCYGTGHGDTSPKFAAYSAIVRSLENFPELATSIRPCVPGILIDVQIA